MHVTSNFWLSDQSTVNSGVLLKPHTRCCLFSCSHEENDKQTFQLSPIAWSILADCSERQRAVITADCCLFRWIEALSKLNVLSIQLLIVPFVRLCRSSRRWREIKGGGTRSTVWYNKLFTLENYYHSKQECLILHHSLWITLWLVYGPCAKPVALVTLLTLYIQSS